MKLAAQTVLWGNRIESISRILDTLTMNGFHGVEFSQCPEQLGKAHDLRQMLSDRKIELVGLSGGTLRDRVAYCGSVLRPEFLYVERWDEVECRPALKAGFRLALHPHVFKPVHRLATAGEILKQHPELLFLPDAAHLTIAGDSPAEAVLKWRSRLAAVHLKDWTPVYGRSSHRYARGFVELGNGIINFDLLFDRLHMIDYRGWLVVEQGSPAAALPRSGRHRVAAAAAC